MRRHQMQLCVILNKLWPITSGEVLYDNVIGTNEICRLEIEERDTLEGMVIPSIFGTVVSEGLMIPQEKDNTCLGASDLTVWPGEKREVLTGRRVHIKGNLSQTEKWFSNGYVYTELPAPIPGEKFYLLRIIRRENTLNFSILTAPVDGRETVIDGLWDGGQINNPSWWAVRTPWEFVERELWDLERSLVNRNQWGEYEAIEPMPKWKGVGFLNWDSIGLSNWNRNEPHFNEIKMRLTMIRMAHNLPKTDFCKRFGFSPTKYNNARSDPDIFEGLIVRSHANPEFLFREFLPTRIRVLLPAEEIWNWCAENLNPGYEKHADYTEDWPAMIRKPVKRRESWQLVKGDALYWG